MNKPIDNFMPPQSIHGFSAIDIEFMDNMTDFPEDKFHIPTNNKPIDPLNPELYFSYLQESARTASDKFHGKHVDYNKFLGALDNYKRSSQQLDRYKKLLFYGEDQAKGRTKDHTQGKDGYSITESFSTDNESEIKARYILHALLGIMTEAGEMAELLSNTIVGNVGSGLGSGNLPSGSGGIDTVNLIEECGDLFWYQAMLARALDTDFETMQRTNIAKLKARFPDKFTETNANVRDLEKERAILENGYDVAMKGNF